MVTRIILYLGAITLLGSCIMPYRRLENNTKVPLKGYKFRNADKFDPAIYQQIDPNYFYRSVYDYSSDGNFNIDCDTIYDCGKKYPNTSRVLQFYPKGQIRIMGYRYPKDPEYGGNRGVVYLDKKGRIKMKLFGAIAPRTSGILSYKVKVEGDYIYVLENRGSFFFFMGLPANCEVYKKGEKIPDDWKEYDADW